MRLYVLPAIVITFFQFACNQGADESKLGKDPLYSFYIAGHTYGTPGVDNSGVHPPFKEKFEMLNTNEFIEFGIFTGDIVVKCDSENWNDADSDISLLNHPVYFAPGNHDLTDKELFENRYGKTYQSFLHNSDLFIILDANIDYWNIKGEQLEFLKSQLEQHAKSVDNVFVFFHQLIWWAPDNEFKSFEPNSLGGRARDSDFWTEVAPLFYQLENNVFMFAGDVGAFANGREFMYHEKKNITLIASGMGGGQRDNIVIVDILESKEVEFKLIALNGNDISALGGLKDFRLPHDVVNDY